MAEMVSNQLARQLTEMVDNFTLLDILSKEEQEELLSRKIDNIKAKNEERLRRHQEVEADKASALGSTPIVSSPSANPTDHSQTTSQLGPASPVSSSSPTPADTRSVGAGSSGSSTGSRPGSGKSGGGSGRRRGTLSPVDQPSPLRSHADIRKIELINTGSGLGFGLVEFKGRGVAVKTIVKGGAAALDGRLETGDLLLSINNTEVQDKSRDQVVDILKECKGIVNLVITREIFEAPQSASWGDQKQHQQFKRDTSRGGRRGGQRGGGGYSKDSIKDHEGDQRKNLTISVDADPSCEGGDREVSIYSGRGRGSRGRRGRGGQMSGLSREEVKYKEWGEKKQANIDLVEAEIQAMRDAYEAERNAGVSVPICKSVYSFLNDPRRCDPGHTQESLAPQESHQEVARLDMSRRSQHSWGGQQFDDVVNKMSKPHRGRDGSQYPGPQTKQEMQVTMTGKERREYEQWKREREKIDQERIARHKQHAQGEAGREGGGGGGRWSREWDKEKQTMEPTGQSQTEQWGETQQNTWSSRRADNYRDIRVYGGRGFNDQSTTDEDRLSQGGQPGVFDGHQETEVVRGRGRPRGRSQRSRGGRRGRVQNISDRSRYHKDIGDPGIICGEQVETPSENTPPLEIPPVQEITFKGGCPPEGALAEPIGTWQAADESDVTLPRVVSGEEQKFGTETLKVETSFEGPEALSNPMSPLSPGAGWTTPTDHTHVVDWAAEANNNSGWDLPPTSPSAEMYAFNLNFEAAAAANTNWGDAKANKGSEGAQAEAGQIRDSKNSQHSPKQT